MTSNTAEFYGFTGDPEHDRKQKARIIAEVGADNFDIDIPAYEPDTTENWNHMEPYDQANDR